MAKYYVIVHGQSQAWNSTVHTENCPLLPRMKHAKEKDYNPLDNDKWNHYTPCQICKPRPTAHPRTEDE